jgi:hypothetical protein
MQTFEIIGFELIELDFDGARKRVGIIKDKNEADAWRMKNPSWRGMNYIKETITICDSLAEFEVMEKQALIAQALAKLTAEERAALGV